jgi:hypothetical protein
MASGSLHAGERVSILVKREDGSRAIATAWNGKVVGFDTAAVRLQDATYEVIGGDQTPVDEENKAMIIPWSQIVEIIAYKP